MFANQLKKLRSKRKISQFKLAELLGVAQQTVASWETSKSSPNYDLLKNIARLFQVTTDYLLEMPSHIDVTHPIDFPKEIRLHMEKYRSISSAGKAVVDATLDAVWRQEHEKSTPNVEKREIS